MNKSTVLEKILHKYNDLNKAEKRVARIVQENPEGIVKMTINELAQLGRTSETTVFRFCDRLGFKGYSEFKINLAMELTDTAKELHADIDKNDDIYLVSQKMLTSYINSAKKTINNNDIKVLNDVVNCLLEAPSLYFFGMGGSYSIADDSRHKFVRFNQNSFAESDSHWQELLVATSKPKDVCFLFSNSGSNKDLIDLLQSLKDKRIVTVGISNSHTSPLAKVVDHHLIAYEEGARFVTEAMESRQTTMLLMDILFVSTSLKKMEHVEKNLKYIRKGIAKRRV